MKDDKELEAGLPGAGNVFDRWLHTQRSNIRRHFILLLTENDGTRDEVIEELREIARGHYVAPDVTARRLEQLGAPATAKLLREHLPSTKRARSGDLGEILATEIAECKLGYKVPIRRLRWKDGRNMALRGDDILGVRREPDAPMGFLKGESKSRISLSATAVTEAAVALDRDRGRPTLHSVLFVAERLSQAGQDDLAKELEEAVLRSFRDNSVEHLLFTVSGNDPNKHLLEHLETCKKRRRRYVVGVRVEDHREFIEQLFSEM